MHKYLHEGGELPPGVSFRDGIIYHCGPVMMKQPDGSYICTAAGPALIPMIPVPMTSADSYGAVVE